MTAECSTRVLALQAGDGDAWAALLTEFGPQIEGYVRRMGARDAEDVTGSTFESVARTIGNFTGSDSQFRSWIFTIAHARMVDDHRRRNRRPEVELGHEVERIADDRLEAVFGGDERIELALAQLAPDQRALLHLRYVVGLSIREVAIHTDRTEEATRAAIHRCTKRLRELVSVAAVAVP